MKILHVINNLGSGGAEKLILDILPLIKERGYDVELLLLNNRNSVYYEELKQKINIDVINYKSNFNPLNLLKLLKKIKKYEIVHSHTFPANYWVAISSFFVKNKIFITTEHNINNKRRGYKLFKVIENILYARYNKIIAISKKTMESLVKWIPNLEKKISVIENGVDLKKIKMAKPLKRIKLGYKESDKLIIMVGRFSKNKDQKTIIKAIELLPEEFKLLLVGEGELIEEDKKMVKTLRINARVDFLGFRNNIPELFKMCDLSIISSHWEGFGLVAVEGMVAGLPVIASDVDGLNDVVRGAGILFEQGNEKKLAKEIEKIFFDKSYYDIVKKKCIKRAENYSIEKMVDGYLRVYDEK